MFLNKLTTGLLGATVALAGLLSGAFAQDRKIGKPTEGGIQFQDAATDLATEAHWFHNELLMPIIVAISLFVLVLLVIVVFKFREKKNPVPSKTTHNTVLEVIWTAVPILILGVIGYPSFQLLYLQDTIPDTELVIRATGNQWNWTYDYPDNGNINFTAVLIPDDVYKDASAQQEYETALTNFLGFETKLHGGRLLDTDLRLVVPVDTKVELQITASDVLHAWTVPSFGVKVDAVPGRMNRLWFKVNEVGTYYGQCSELCGKDHAFMPIAVEVVTKEEFAAWVERAKAEYADAGTVYYASAAVAALDS